MWLCVGMTVNERGRQTAIRMTMPSLQENRMTSGFIESNNPAHTKGVDGPAYTVKCSFATHCK